MTESAPSPSDRTGRFLRALNIDETIVAANAANVVIELVADQFEPATEIAVALTATLLLRLADFAPTIRLVVPRTRTVTLPRLPDTPLPEALRTAHEGFGSANRITTDPGGRCDLRLVFDGDADGLPVSTCGWAVAIGERLDGSGNALAAAYAGVLAAAEAFKTILARLGVLPKRSSMWRGVVSLWDYSMTANPGAPLAAADLGEHTWVGAGGVASATAWTLAALNHAGVALTGNGNVIDADTIDADGTNLNRHLIALMADLNTSKAQLLADIMTSSGMDLSPHPTRWENLPASLRRPQLAVVSVDDDAVRRTVQYDMPTMIVNAGTGDHGEYQVSAHNFLDNACLACISRADRTASSPEANLAARLRVPLAVLQPVLNSRELIPASLLAQAYLTDQQREDAARIKGRELLQHFCDSIQLDNDRPAVSAPMLTAAAGVLLAVELVKRSLSDMPTTYGQVIRTNILTGPHARWQSQRSKTPQCHCTDDLYRNHYRTLHGTTARDVVVPPWSPARPGGY